MEGGLKNRNKILNLKFALYVIFHPINFEGLI